MDPEDFEQLIAGSVFLNDEKFLEAHPGIIDALAFMDTTASTFYRQDGCKYGPYDRVGANCTADYFRLLEFGNEEVLRTCDRLSDILNFH